jgi:anti-sigma regulatory factor (Ser/Thr protein kinase)
VTAVDERRSFARGAEAPAQARNAVSGWLAGHVNGRALEDIKLLVSELVTNAVRHQSERGAIEMAVAVRNRHVRVEVTDPGGGFDKPTVGEPPPDEIGGRGLLIVDRVASRWGVTPGRPTRVWFELER